MTDKDIQYRLGDNRNKPLMNEVPENSDKKFRKLQETRKRNFIFSKPQEGQQSLTQFLPGYDSIAYLMEYTKARITDYRDEGKWKPENDPNPDVQKPKGNHSYTTAMDYLRAQSGDQQAKDQYLERAMEDIHRLEAHLRTNNDHSLTIDKEPTDTENKRQEYFERCRDIYQSLESQIKEQGDQREPDNTRKPWMVPDCSWIPKRDHSYTTAMDYLRAQSGDQQAKEKYLESVMKDINRFQRYFRQAYSRYDNSTRRKKQLITRDLAIKNKYQEYLERCRDIYQSLESQIEEQGDQRKPDNTPRPWMPEGDHSYTTAMDYLRAQSGNQQAKEQYLKRVLQDIVRFQEHLLRNEMAYVRQDAASGYFYEDKYKEYLDRRVNILEPVEEKIEQKEDIGFDIDPESSPTGKMSRSYIGSILWNV